MSKYYRLFIYILAVVLQILQSFYNSQAQTLDARITLDVSSKPSVTVEGRFLDAKRENRRNFVFLDSYAGTLGLADRVSVTGLAGPDGKPVDFKRFVAGEYVAGADFDTFKYTLSLAPVGRPSAMAHISWLREDRGILMLDDLLPQGAGKVSARISLKLPEGWEATSTALSNADRSYDIDDVSRSMFVIYRQDTLRRLTTADRLMDIDVMDSWLVSDKEISEMVSQIRVGYEGIFGKPRRAAYTPRVTMMRFPAGTPPGTWEADTRGSSVTIISSDMPFKAQSIQKLHEQLRHELFHLWIPNSVNLTGNYDWFYEGFALYTSLKLGTATKQIRFDDFLASMSQAFTIEDRQIDKISLIDASKNRWSGANTRVYARGMIVAFLSDIEMISASAGRNSVETLIGEVLRDYNLFIEPSDGNTAVLTVMRKHPELRPIADSYIQGAEKIDWSSYLKTAGLESAPNGPFTKLRVVAKPKGKQKDLLKRLGYNQ